MTKYRKLNWILVTYFNRPKLPYNVILNLIELHLTCDHIDLILYYNCYNRYAVVTCITARIQCLIG